MGHHDPVLEELMRRALTRRRLLGLAAAVPLGGVLLSACGDDEEDTPSEASTAPTATSAAAETSAATTAAATTAAETAAPETSAATTAAAEERFDGVTIQVTTRPNLDHEVQGFKEAIVSWEARTGGKVNFTLVPYEEIAVKWAGYLASEDDSVDVLYGLEALVGQYGPTLYSDLTDLIDVSDYVPAAIQANSVEGRLYGVPAHSEMAFFIYNKAYFEAAGLDPEAPPKTWAELYAAAPQLNADGHTANATTLLFPAENLMFFAVFLNSTDTTLLSDDLTKVNFENDEGLLAFQTWSDGISSGFFDKSLLNSAGELYDTGKVFNNGETASMINYVELWGAAVDPAQSKVSDVVGTSIMPGCKAGKTGSVNGFECFGVSKFSKNPEAALSFIKELTGPRGAEDHDRGAALSVEPTVGPERPRGRGGADRGTAPGRAGQLAVAPARHALLRPDGGGVREGADQALPGQHRRRGRDAGGGVERAAGDRRVLRVSARGSARRASSPVAPPSTTPSSSTLDAMAAEIVGPRGALDPDPEHQPRTRRRPGLRVIGGEGACSRLLADEFERLGLEVTLVEEADRTCQRRRHPPRQRAAVARSR